MAVDCGHGEDCSTLRWLFNLLLARNMILDRQVFTGKNVALDNARMNVLLEYWC